jgi:hypothetical protein
MTFLMMLFMISAVIIGVCAAMPIQNTHATTNDHRMDNSCKHNQPSDSSKKCSQIDSPFILPFP